MRFLIVFALIVLAQTPLTPAFADDEFGARFGSNSTVGFEDATTDPEKALSEIAPAAGDEEPADTDKAQNASEGEKADGEAQTQVPDLR